MHVHVPAGLQEVDRPLEELVAHYFPVSHAALEAASSSLFYSLPIAFDPAESAGPFLATADRDAEGRPYRFLDMGALIATQAFGENDPAIVAAVLRDLPSVVSRFAHSEYQTVVSLRLKAQLNRIAPRGTPRHFVVNTGAEAVENAIKSVLLNRVRTAGEVDGGFIISFEGAFHGRTLGSLAVTHRRKARLGFPTFDWPHASFPVDDPSSQETAKREERSLRQVWDLIVTGRLPHAPKSKEAFQRELEAIDQFLAQPETPDAPDFVAARRAAVAPEILKRARRVAAVLVEPIQGEGGLHMATARFFRRLRLLTGIYEVPLMFDEVQTGFGATGRLWAHELFDLPLPPDVVVWAKKAQNGVLFVSEQLATFFQEEKKFNTTWEGDSVGMIRLLSILDKLDLEQVRRTGAIAREGLAALARDFPELILNVRGEGVLLGFDAARADWRDALRDRAFRLGLILLPAGERALRFYPRFDTEPAAIAEALEILRRAVQSIVRDDERALATIGPELRMGTLECPLAGIDPIDLTPQTFEANRAQVMCVETERYGAISQYPPDVLRDGRRSLLQYPVETLESTIAHVRSVGLALRDRVSGRIVAYALGSPIENHDEEGVSADPRQGENDTFYLQAMATLPLVRNQVEVENLLLDLLREKVLSSGFTHVSALIEERLRETGPRWLGEAAVLRRIENYLRSGIRFVYVQAAIGKDVPPAPAQVEPAPEASGGASTTSSTVLATATEEPVPTGPGSTARLQ
jgi:4-aminobutyrate aminotransferase-like enzyme